MGFIDSMTVPPESDLYRFADPSEKVHRLAVEDMQATAQSAAAPAGQSPIPNPQSSIPNPQSPISNPQSSIPTVPGHRRILTSQEWVRQNYPDVPGQRFLSPVKRKHILEGYKLYLAVQEMGMRERMSQFHAKMRAAELGERRAGRVQGAKGSRVQGAKGQGVEGVAREDMFPKNYYAEKIAGPAKVDPLLSEAGMSQQGLLGRMRKGPAQWLAAYKQIEAMIPFNSDRTNMGLAQALSKSKPSAEDVEAALEAGEITPEMAEAILEIILTPEQLESHKERARAIENAPKPSFWDRLLPGPSARPAPGKVTPY